MNLVDKCCVLAKKAVDFFERERNGVDSTIAITQHQDRTAASATARGPQRRTFQVPEIRSMCAVNKPMKLVRSGMHGSLR